MKHIFKILASIGIVFMMSCNTISNSEQVVGVQDSLRNTTDTSLVLSQSLNVNLPSIVGINHLGDSIYLQKMAAKYILIEFWASWCPPCRKSNPGLLQVYNKYKSKGFDIFSISLDDKKSKWQDAIYQDQLTWHHHLCDFKGWDSPLAQQYHIESIPNNILIDQNGKEIAKELSPEQLDALLNTIIH